MADLDKMALLPCPFCGNPKVQLVTIKDEDGDGLHAVGCPKCGCNGAPHIASMDDPRPAAAASWNRRTAPAIDRARPTNRRQKAVELLLSQGYRWQDGEWQAPQVASAIDLGAFRERIAAVLQDEFDLEAADPEDLRHEDGHSEALRIADRLLALIDGQASAAKPGAHYADAEALVAHLASLVDDDGQGGDHWEPAKAAIAGIRAWQAGTMDLPDLCDICGVREETRTDAEGTPFCQQCWDEWQASEQPTKGEAAPMPGNCIVAALVAWALAPTRTHIRRMRNRVGRWHWYWVRDGQAWEFHAPGRSRLPYWRNALYLGVPRRMGGRTQGGAP